MFALIQGRAQLRNTGIQELVSAKLCLLCVQQNRSGMIKKENATAGLKSVNVTTKYGTQIYACA